MTDLLHSMPVRLREVIGDLLRGFPPPEPLVDSADVLWTGYEAGIQLLYQLRQLIADRQWESEQLAQVLRLARDSHLDAHNHIASVIALLLQRRGHPLPHWCPACERWLQDLLAQLLGCGHETS